MRKLIFLIMLFPSIVLSQSFELITKNTVVDATGVLPNQIFHNNQNKHELQIIVPEDNLGKVAGITCQDIKLFSINADRPDISGTHTEFNVMHVMIAKCDNEKLGKKNIEKSAKKSQLQMKKLLQNSNNYPENEKFLPEIRTLTLNKNLSVYSFTIPIFGRGGAAMAHTAIMHDINDANPLVVQVFFADYFLRNIGMSPKLDTPVTAPLRRAHEDALGFAINILRAAHSIIEE